MKEYSLDFCNIIHHDNGILEVVVNDGVEVTAEMARQFVGKAVDIKPEVTAILVNRKYDYSYTFKANIILASSKNIECLAVVKYKKMGWPLKSFFFPKFYKLAFFDNTEEATEWLLKK